MTDYRQFIERRQQIGRNEGFDPLFMPSQAFGFQRALIEWAVRKGRGAIFADCGLGKTLMQLAWAENVRLHSGLPVLIVAPIAVGVQTTAEAAKFGIEAAVSRDGRVAAGLTITNYERLHHFDTRAFGGVVCDESSIIKDATGATRKEVTEFLRTQRYRLLCTATAAPNDWHELGTSSEALGGLGFRDMITAYFRQETSKDGRGWGRTKYRFKGHAKQQFFRWVCSWARACRSPADLGFPADGFALPPLTVEEHRCDRVSAPAGKLFAVASGRIEDQREERRATIGERCEMAAALADHADPCVLWCHLNDEGDELARRVRDCVQVSGADDDDEKEAKLLAFTRGDVRALVTKPKIGAWGMNWQHCADTVMFPSHSYEQYYQTLRRFWRFGQRRHVRAHIVTSEGEEAVTRNLQRKADQCDEMFSALVAEMNHAISATMDDGIHTTTEIPSWL